MNDGETLEVDQITLFADEFSDDDLDRPVYADDPAEADAYRQLLTRIESNYPLLTAQQEYYLGLRVQAGDKLARQRFIEANLLLVASYVGRYTGGGLTPEDLFQYGVLGLIKGVDKFDPLRGYRFSTYATWPIRRSMQEALSKYGRSVPDTQDINNLSQAIKSIEVELTQKNKHLPTNGELAEWLGESIEKIERAQSLRKPVRSLEEPMQFESEPAVLADLIGDPHSPDPVEQTDKVLKRQLLFKTLGTLSLLERRVMIMRYGLKDNIPRLRKEIAEALHVSISTVTRTEKRIADHWRNSSEGKTLREAFSE